jgi:methylmalonyl-CoA mutase C-terminal domain/subunit
MRLHNREAVLLSLPYIAPTSNHSGHASFQRRSRKRGEVTVVAQPIRVLLAKVGLDGHDRGVRVVARTLRDAGMDVIYSGLHRTPEEVVNAAIQEDVDVLGVSLLSGVQLTVFPKIFKLLDDKGVKDLILVAGGVMPDEDVVALKDMGVHEVMLQDTPPEAIVATLTRLVNERGAR